MSQKINYLSIGDICKVEGQIKIPDKSRNNKGFDYSIYLRTQKIIYSVMVSKIDFIKREENIFSKIFDIKIKLLKIIEQNYSNDEAGFLKAILLGDKTEISPNIKEDFNKSNLSHIIAISGLHVTYITLFIDKFLGLFLKRIKIKNSFIILFLIFFMVFVGAAPSVIRACTMMIIYYIAKIFLNEKDFYISFCVTILLLLLINPYNIYSISMWLSYGGTLGIVLFANFIQKILQKNLKIKSNIKKKVLEIISISIAAQILIFPIIWKNFGTLSFSFWISNLLVSELVGPVLIIGYMSFIFFPFRNIIVFIEKILLKIFLLLVAISAKIPFNRVFLQISNIFIILYYFSIISLTYLYRKEKITFLKCCLNFKYLRNKILKYKIIFTKVFIFVFSVMIIIFLINLLPKDLRINVLDVRTR